jgi:ATP-binding cassette subfamily C exporter for protease/lipase
MSKKNAPSELREAMDSLRPALRRALWFSLAISLLVLAPTGYMLEVYDRVVNARSHMTLAMLTIVVLGAYVVMELLDWARTEILRKAGRELDRKLSARVFDMMFEANLRRVPGGSTQPMSDLRTVRDFLHAPVLTALMESPVSLVFMVLIFAMSPVLGWAAVAGGVVQTGIAWFNERATQPPLSQASRTSIAAQQYADGSLRNAEVIEAMGMLRNIHRRWMERQREFLRLQAVASDAGGTFQAAAKFVQQVMGSLLLGLGAWLLMRNQLNGGAGMMIIASVLGGRMLAPLVQAVSQWRAVVGVRDAWSRLEALMEQLPARKKGMALPQPKGALSVDGLVAGAPGSPVAIVRGIQFSLTPGQVLAVVGPSASGKTTLARLLVGLWPAGAGKVRLDGADVFVWDKAELGPQVGYLPQGVELFEGTLAENIARFGPVDMAKVIDAARLVGLHDYILSLPQGYESPVGRDGAMLSGGQRQRAALARALYGRPVFVVLDEPNSSLDEEGDAALAAAITEIKGQGTTFVVMTHRTSVLAVADMMLVLRDGAQQAFGPRDEVLGALAKAAQEAQQPRPGAAPGAGGMLVKQPA